MTEKDSSLEGGNLTFVGHVSIDKIENVHGMRIQPGGGALYSAIAAKVLNAKVSVVSAIGRDFAFHDSLGGLDSSCLRTFKAPTTRFHISYDKNWEDNYVEVEHGAGARITSSIIAPRLLRSSSLIHLSPMKPAKVTKIVSDIRQKAPKIEVSMSTWLGYTRNARNRKLLTRLASQVDFFMLNEFEAKALTQVGPLSLALERIKAPKLIVTMGKLGAIMSGNDVEPQMVPALSVPSEKIMDTTGAGDTWVGAFLAAYKATSDLVKSVTAASMVSSIKCSRWGFEALKGLTFKKPSDVVEYVLALREGWMQKKITEFCLGWD